MARFTISGEGKPPVVFPLAPGETRIGRATDNDAVLEGDGVSRYHARLVWEASAYRLEDLGSKNGTMVNGKRLDAPRDLAEGDVITIPGWTLKFEAEDATVTRPFAPTADAMPPAGGQELVLNAATREAVVRGNTVLLPPKEYLALSLLYERAGTVVSKEDLAEHVWPEYNGDVSDYNIHQVLSRLRREIEEDPSRPRLLITRPGFGYILNPGG